MSEAPPPCGLPDGPAGCADGESAEAPVAAGGSVEAADAGAVTLALMAVGTAASCAVLRGGDAIRPMIKAMIASGPARHFGELFIGMPPCLLLSCVRRAKPAIRRSSSPHVYLMNNPWADYRFGRAALSRRANAFPSPHGS